MKNALKIALPTVLAIVLGWIAIEGIKWGRDQWKAEKDAKSLRAQQAAAIASESEIEE